MGKQLIRMTGNVAAAQQQLEHSNADYLMQSVRKAAPELAGALEDRQNISRY